MLVKRPEGRGIPAKVHAGESIVDAETVKWHGVKFFEKLKESAGEGYREMQGKNRIKDPVQKPIVASTGGLVQPLSQQRLNELYPPSNGFVSPPVTNANIVDANATGLIEEPAAPSEEEAAEAQAQQQAATQPWEGYDGDSAGADGSDANDAGSATGSGNSMSQDFSDVANAVANEVSDVSATQAVSAVAGVIGGPVASIASTVIGSVIGDVFGPDMNDGTNDASEAAGAAGSGDAGAESGTDAGNVGHGDGSGTASEGGDDGGGGGGDGSVICTYLNSKDMVPQKTFVRKNTIGSKIPTPVLSNLARGYHAWAKPYVKFLKWADKRWIDKTTQFVSLPVIRVVSGELHWSAFYGIPVAMVGFALCSIVGLFTKK